MAYVKIPDALISIGEPVKKEILQKVLNRFKDIPATYLLEHSDLMIITDKEAY